LDVPLLVLLKGTVRMALALWHSHVTSVGVVELGLQDDVSHSEPVGTTGAVMMMMMVVVVMVMMMMMVVVVVDDDEGDANEDVIRRIIMIIISIIMVAPPSLESALLILMNIRKDTRKSSHPSRRSRARPSGSHR
jgi:heme/copper-type cytochrome/quinol oxidase subunit 2